MKSRLVLRYGRRHLLGVMELLLVVGEMIHECYKQERKGEELER